jgi:hypothetical protein
MKYTPKAKSWDEAPEAVKYMYMERVQDMKDKYVEMGFTVEQAWELVSKEIRNGRRKRARTNI